MTERISYLEFRQRLKPTLADGKPWNNSPKLAKPSKYRNQPTEYAGRTYASKLEAEHAAALDIQKRQGLIRGWLPQVSLPATAKRRLVVDFLVIRNDGTVRLEDTKGVAPTKDWQIKREEVERQLGIPVDIIIRTRR